jgi:hypothetical protein
VFDLKQSIEWNKQKAYSGKLGQSREIFCNDFTKKKFAQIKDIEDGQLQEAEENKSRITCKKQCRFSSCCMEYIEATIQECETIVYYLYNHSEALSKFLKNYPEWREKVLSGGDLYKEIDKIFSEFLVPQAKLSNMRRLHELDQKYLDLHIQYFDSHNPCPFSCGNECIIYDVRPFTCVCSYSTSPADLCGMSDKILPPINRSAPPEESLNSSFYFGEIKTPGLFFMPLAVYEILARGYEYLADVTGLDELRKEAKRQHLIQDTAIP